MFSHKKRYKIRAKVHGKGGIFLTGRLACAPLLDWTAVAGPAYQEDLYRAQIIQTQKTFYMTNVLKTFMCG